ncbi:MAG: peptidase T [Lachnospiraceae bacterium]|nr:peptidase T [Lachnospiraceae bacterium]
MGKFDGSEVIERFLRYAVIDTQSDEESGTSPSSEKQKNLGRLLEKELKEIGVSGVYFDEEHCYVYGRIPANNAKEGTSFGSKKLALIAHMDTSPESSGKDVKPRIVENYDGGDIYLGDASGLTLSPSQYPEMKAYVGQSLIVTDGTTLLGADDKAGVAEIMAAASYLLKHPEVSHGEISICFTPDEEIGSGVDHIDMDRLDADYGYTVDGGAIGELEYENFNAAAVTVKVHGVTVHPGEAKNKMKHASRIAMELDSMLPAQERPQFTEGYEGFFYLTDMKGTTEEAEFKYIIRDHDREKFEAKKKLIRDAATYINSKYGEKTAEIAIRDQYYNMREKIEEGNIFLIENAKKAMEDLDIVPKIQPIRGGTDGARLSFMGLPCPNLCAGGHNFHGRFEYVCAESMEKITDLLIKLVSM